ncbi:hypothetical protein [Stappia indica]|uniref:hypothetical protein n=1 Tax=Stappia indica TaxID=538381 RepID=UPI001CD3948E|nr:hypothetical protein [Stappia indica]MCA1297364.1 hypothetical protein [Stappia indica]
MILVQKSIERPEVGRALKRRVAPLGPMVAKGADPTAAMLWSVSARRQAQILIFTDLSVPFREIARLASDLSGDPLPWGDRHALDIFCVAQ